MFTKVSLAIALLVATVSATSDDFLGLERMLQVQGTVFTTAGCAADSACAPGNCCAQYRRNVSGTVTNVATTCVSPLLSGRTVLFSGANHTWTCANATAISAVGTACTANSGCTASGACCLGRTVNVFGVSQAAGSFCGARTPAAVTTFQQYAVGVAPTNFTSNVTYTAQCLADPEPETSSASLIQMTLLAVFAALSTVFF